MGRRETNVNLTLAAALTTKVESLTIRTGKGLSEVVLFGEIVLLEKDTRAIARGVTEGSVRVVSPVFVFYVRLELSTYVCSRTT